MKKKDKAKLAGYKEELWKAIETMRGDKRLLREFLVDILTPREIEQLALRLQIVKRLLKKEKQRSIAADLGIGIATVTRGSRELRNKKGGFYLYFKKKKGL